jgi:chromate transporter
MSPPETTLALLVELFNQSALLAMVAFGGASALLPELHRVVVEQRQWMDERTFAELFAIAQAAPGPNLLVFSLIGWQIAGLAGAVAATLGFCLPMSLVIFVLFRHWERFRDAPWRAALQTGVAPLAVGLVCAGGWFIGVSVGATPAVWVVVALTAGLMMVRDWHPLWYIGAGALAGAFGWI